MNDFRNALTYHFVLFCVLLGQSTVVLAKTGFDVVVSNRFIPHGELLLIEDLQVQEFGRVAHNVFKKKEDVVGKVATVDITSYKPIVAYMVKSPDLVHRNDVVDILYSNENINITLKGIALENGVMSQMIKVRSKADKGMLFKAKVVSSSKVVVE